MGYCGVNIIERLKSFVNIIINILVGFFFNIKCMYFIYKITDNYLNIGWGFEGFRLKQCPNKRFNLIHLDRMIRPP